MLINSKSAIFQPLSKNYILNNGTVNDTLPQSHVGTVNDTLPQSHVGTVNDTLPQSHVGTVNDTLSQSQCFIHSTK